MAFRSTFTLVLASFVWCTANADRTIVSHGKASWHDKDIYTEEVKIRMNDRDEIVNTDTTYINPEGKTIATMKADFSHSLNVPEHHFYDERTGHSYGVRRNGDKIVMYEKPKDKPERSREIDQDFKKGHIMFAGPGLAPYLKAHYQEFKDQKSVPIVILIPGNLDTYNFKVRFEREADGVAEFDVVIESWILRLFAPRIRFKYDSKNQKIIHYEGISNVKTDHEQMQKVRIDYFYDEAS